MTCSAFSQKEREVLIKYVPPYSFGQLLEHLRPRATPGIEAVGEKSYSRLTTNSGTPRIMNAEDAADGLHLRVRVTSENQKGLAHDLERLRYLLAVDENPSEAIGHLAEDKLIGSLVRERPWVRVPRCWDPFETSIRIIIGQQISVAAATTISARVAHKFGQRIATSSDLCCVFPGPEVLAKVDLSDLGLTERRKSTIQNFALAVVNGTVDFETSQELQEVEKTWCALEGIGPWTARLIAMRVLGHDDVMPSSDLGILRSLNRLSKQKVNPKQLERQSKLWKPFRSWSAQHLWQAPDTLRNA